MGLRQHVIVAALVGVTGFAAFGGSRVDPRNGTALDRYVFTTDPAYGYSLDHSTRGAGYTTHVFSLKSQQWRTASEVDHPVWEHWLVMVQPDTVSTSTALLFISGGSLGRAAPQAANPVLASIAVSTGSVMAEIRGVPNEPLKFSGEDRPRSEDAIIAYTWDKFLKTGDDTWPLRLPMTKSAVRAMDAVTDFLGKQNVKVEKYVVAGASKRGWTAWTTAAVDDRVVAVMPLVIDVLNTTPSLQHHFRAYGFWSPSLEDYTALHLMEWVGTPQWKALMKIEDPFSYRDRLTIPKYIVNSAGDQYFLPDSSQFYFDALRGEKYLRYVPNTRHDLDNSDAPASIAAFYETVVKGVPRPRFSWKFEKDGAIVVRTEDKPSEVKLWQATNPKARDFRLDTIGPAYKSSPLQPGQDGSYVARIPAPSEGWTAFFVELTFPGPGKLPLKFTSAVRILPETLPFPFPMKRGQ
jgi:PhoPQ-activated pathogenicity-related protein